MNDSRTRSILKSLSYRIWASIATAIIVFLVTSKWSFAVFAGIFDFFVKIALYFSHERVWQRISYGKAKKPRASVVWFTGLPGSGKTTLAMSLARRLREKKIPVEELDGDSIREIFPQTGFTRADRDTHVRRVGYLASRLESNDVTVIASLISPFHESRKFVRDLCGCFIEVYLSTPLEVCESRDPKGLYAKARKGEIKGFTGIDDGYDVPLRPDVVIDTSQVDIDSGVDRILAELRSRTRV